MMAGTIFADKTPFIEALEEESPNYRFLFLRPRRFGKSAFLDMLTEYYDIHSADIFEDLFGPLYIGSKPTPSKNQLLVLKFDLSSVDISHSKANLEASFNVVINDVLREFLRKYWMELDSPQEEEIIDASASASLSRVMSIVGKQGQSLFVGVDEYDAPANNTAGSVVESTADATDNVRHIESFFNSNFFSILKQGCGMKSNGGSGVVIDKYFLTGVIPAFRGGISPLTATTIVSHHAKLHGICGFTDEEVKALTKHYLGMDDQAVTPIVHVMKRLYNGYCFMISSDEAGMDQTRLYNPHLVFHYLSNYRNDGFVAKPEESAAVHTTTILKSISDMGEFSVEDLMDIVVSGSVTTSIMTEFGFSDLQKVGKERKITWSLMFYLGVLTLGTKGTLRIPNDVIKSDVIGRVMNFLRTQDKICSLITPSMTNLKAGRARDFQTLLENLLQSRATRSIQNANEAVLQGIVEVLWNEPNNHVPKLCLVIDGTKGPGQGRYGFVDIFVPSCAGARAGDQTCIAMELKNVHLSGLFKAISTCNPTYSDYEALRKAIIAEDDSTLLARKYQFFSQSENKWITTTLESIMESGKTQLRRYMETIALGKFNTFSASGVLDNRVGIVDGLDDIKGYVFMAVGGARVLVDTMEAIDTTNSYVKTLKL
ncbi:hypothetical protein B0O80DRAFT_471260 [Mortierella sp. GBAus27b]|nr:hypothetical protein B0O80DRAFT_471260 [Mortierella sp. GBAus27b]